MALTGVTGFPDWLSAAGAAAQFAAWVVLSSPLPKMLACTAAATLDAKSRIAIAMAAARDRFPCLGSSTTLAVRRRICFRLATFLDSLGSTPRRRPVSWTGLRLATNGDVLVAGQDTRVS
jgi:hypothetical protein